VKKYATGLEIKKSIIKALKAEPVSLRKLETRLNVGYNSIKRHCEELEYLGVIKVKKTDKGSRNGRPYVLAELTQYGKNLKTFK